MTPRIQVVGLGPGDVSLTTPATSAILESSANTYLRTAAHPSASIASGAKSFDSQYDQHETFSQVYSAIVETLLLAATEHGEIVYAVPGSPLVLERTVALLGSQSDVAVVLHPAMSFLDVAWAALGIDPVEETVTLVDGHRFSVLPTPPGPQLVAHCHNQRVLSEIKLSVDDPGDAPVVVLQSLGTADEKVFEVDWWDLDKAVDADHLTSIYIPEPAESPARSLGRLAELVATLRRECPWDREQTHSSLRRHLLEETYEVLDVLDRYDSGADAPGDDELAEELGDLLFQPLIHAAIAAEEGRFSVSDMADGIHDKLVSRHPHVFDVDKPEVTSESLVADWERTKQAEKSRGSTFDGIPAALPALARLAKLQRKAEAIGAERGPADSGAGAELLLGFVEDSMAKGLDPEDRARTITRDYEIALRGREGIDLDKSRE